MKSKKKMKKAQSKVKKTKPTKKTKGRELMENIDTLKTLLATGNLRPEAIIDFKDHQVHEGLERQWRTEVLESKESKSSRPSRLPVSGNGIPAIHWFPKWVTNLFKK